MAPKPTKTFPNKDCEMSGTVLFVCLLKAYSYSYSYTVIALPTFNKQTNSTVLVISQSLFGEVLVVLELKFEFTSDL